MKRVRLQATLADNELLLSSDAKATVKVGELSRGGVSRVPVKALDHDFSPDAKVTPFGIFLPVQDELYITMATSKVTSDFIVDTYDQWWVEHRSRFPKVDTLVLLQDNGPENHSRRTQFMSRMVDFVQKNQVNVRLAYYPPYHSKYNPIERCWGVLENHWNGALLDSISATVEYAKTMTWKGVSPVVRLATEAYELGVKLTKNAMRAIEAKMKRLPNLEPWFVEIDYDPSGQFPADP